MSRKKFRTSILALAFGVLVMAGTESAMAQTSTTTKTTTTEPTTFTALTCDTFEPITFTGSVKTVYEVKDDHDGSPRKLKMSVTWDDVTGTTLSGRVYKASSTSKEAYDLDGLPSYQRTSMNQRFKSKTKGAADSTYTLKIRIKVDVDGNVTQDKESERVECK
jgi:hypothetical protein